LDCPNPAWSYLQAPDTQKSHQLGKCQECVGIRLRSGKKIPLNKGTFMENKKPIGHIRFGDPNIGIHGFTKTPMKSQKFRREVK